MYKTTQVAIYRLTSTYTLYEDNTIFSYRNDKNMVWLQKICFWILNKLKAYHIDSKNTVQILNIPNDKIIDIIEQNCDNINDIILGYTPHTLLIGSEEFFKLINDDPIYDQGLEFSVMGLKVKVIPWMKGMLVLPSETLNMQ